MIFIGLAFLIMFATATGAILRELGRIANSMRHLEIIATERNQAQRRRD